MAPPHWLQRHAVLHHRPTGSLFEVNRLRQQRGTGLYFVFDTAVPDSLDSAPQVERDGYALSDCEPARLDHFQAPCWVKQSGHQVYVPDERGVELKESEDSAWLVLEPVYLAAYALATFLGGAVLNMESSEQQRPQWADIAGQVDRQRDQHQQEILLHEVVESD